MVKPPVLVLVAALALALLSGCAADEGSSPATPPAQSAASTPAAQTDASATEPALRANVHAYAATMMADIKAAEDRGDLVDGVPVGLSSNPYDYVGISPAYVKLVTLGAPALPAIAAEILASKHDGLREYLLAAAGEQIGGEAASGDTKAWSTGKQWARQYRAEH